LWNRENQFRVRTRQFGAGLVGRPGSSGVELSPGFVPLNQGLGSVMKVREQFQRNAQEAMDEADKAESREERSSWLRIAATWLGMLARHQTTPQEDRFDEEIQRRGTRQQESDATH